MHEKNVRGLIENQPFMVDFVYTTFGYVETEE
jgi:hypothetical protein